MTRKILIAVLVSIAWLAPARLFAAGPVSAVLEKVRGYVTESGDGAGAAIPLKTGSTVTAGHSVSVGHFGLAVYKIGQEFMLKQDPRTLLAFTNIAKTTGTANEPVWNVGIRLQNGDLFSALQPGTNEQLNYLIATSRIEATTHDATFKVSHSFSTSTVSVRYGTVDVRYCNLTKHVLVHAGEVFIVTDCNGVLRWQTDEEARGLMLFAALTGAGFGTDIGMQMAMLDYSGAVLAPTVPVSLPIVSP